MAHWAAKKAGLFPKDDLLALKVDEVVELSNVILEGFINFYFKEPNPTLKE